MSTHEASSLQQVRTQPSGTLFQRAARAGLFVLSAEASRLHWQGRKAASHLRDYAGRVGSHLGFPGWGMRNLRWYTDDVRHGSRSSSGEVASFTRHIGLGSNANECEGAPVQDLQSSPAASGEGRSRETASGDTLSRIAASLSDHLGFPGVRPQGVGKPRSYKCPACQVMGVGDECWYCGTNAIIRSN